jgi:hypothetical protein
LPTAFFSDVVALVEVGARLELLAG